MSTKHLTDSSGNTKQYNSLSTSNGDDGEGHEEHTHNDGHFHTHGQPHNEHANTLNGADHGHGHSHNEDSTIEINDSASDFTGSVSDMDSETSSMERGKTVNCGGLNPKLRAELADSNPDPANERARKKLWLASGLCFAFMICEIVGGVFANSLAIMTDAAHLLSDLAGFLISIFALWLATRAPTSRLSFGFHRAEILGALISVLLIWLLTGVLVYEAIWRVQNPQDVDGKLMFIVASTGLAVNICLGFILHQSGHGHSHGLGPALPETGHGHSHSPPKSKSNGHGHSHGGDDHSQPKNINVTAAFIHVLGDALQSAGVMVAAGLIWYNPEWKIADPITTFVFSILVLFTTTRLIKQSIGVLMEGVPEGIDPDAVEASLAELPGVLEVHDLHIWSLSIGKPSLSVHLLATEDSDQSLLAAANQLCAKRFNIHHSTIQVENRYDKIQCNL